VDPRFQYTTQADISIDGELVVVRIEGGEHKLERGEFYVAVEPWTPGTAIGRGRLDPSPLREIRFNRRSDGGPGYVGKLDERDPLIDALIAMDDRLMGQVRGPYRTLEIAEARRRAFGMAGDDTVSLALIAAADSFLTDRDTDAYKLGVLPRDATRPSRDIVERLQQLAASGHPGMVRLNEIVGYAVERAGGTSTVDQRPAKKPEPTPVEPSWKLVGGALLGVSVFVGIAFFALPLMLRSVEEQRADMLASGDQFDVGIGADRIAIIFLGFFAIVGLAAGVISAWEALERYEPTKPAMDAAASFLGVVGKVMLIAALVVVGIVVAGWLLIDGGCDGQLVPVDRFGSYECLEQP
jgi:hypothetical protein